MTKPTDFVFDSSRIKWNTPEDKAAFEASADDWADEMAKKLNLSDLTYQVDIEDVAFALRKAKADGMREAAELVDLVDSDARKLSILANNIENPPTE